jgi:hypothetical protein
MSYTLIRSTQNTRHIYERRKAGGILPGIFRIFLSLQYQGGANRRSQSLFKIELLFTLRIRPLILD